MALRRALAVVTVAASAPGMAEFAAPRLAPSLLAQVIQPPTPRGPFTGPMPAPAPVERLGPDRVRIGSIVIDTGRQELAVSGFVNDVRVLEFLANTKGGWKAYESALELDTNAINFNVACLLIGLDPTGAVVARYQFDPEPPKGQALELFVEWDENGRRRRVRAEEIIYNQKTGQTLAEGPWVYTGSAFQQGNRYMAEVEGTLVGFMHTPAPIIESPRPINGAYGDSIINPSLNLKPGTVVQLIVRALPRQTTPTGR